MNEIKRLTEKIHQFDTSSNVGVQTVSNQSPNKLGTVSKNNNIYNSVYSFYGNGIPINKTNTK